MRIAVYSHFFLPEISAPSARFAELARHWIEAGHEVHAATCFPNYPKGVLFPGYRLQRYRHEVLQGIHVHRGWTFITANDGFVRRSLGHLTMWLSARLITTRRMPRPTCTVGTSPTLFAAMAARDGAARHGVPFIMEVRDLWPAVIEDLGVVRNRRVMDLLRKWEMSLYRSATRIVVLTEAFRRNLVARGIPPDRIAVITNGADPAAWEAAPEAAQKLRAELGLNDAFVALYIGTHGISQALGAQLKAAARLRGHRSVQFLFVGEGAEKARLIHQARRLELDNVRFFDAVDKGRTRAFITMADVCLVPLRNIRLFETCIPSKIFEILAVGRPMVASVRGESAEILERSGAAVLVPPEDDAAVAAALFDLSRNPARLRALALSGPGFVREHYSSDRLACRYLDVINEAVAEGRGRIAQGNGHKTAAR